MPLQDVLLETPDPLAPMLREYVVATERLQRTHEQLQGELKRLRAELASKDRELERRRRLAALGELAAGVAHEVRNPLGAIQLFASLLRKNCAEAPASLALLDRMETAIRAIDDIVQDTLTLAPRLRELRDFRVSDLVSEAIDMCSERLSQHRCTVQCSGPAAQATVQVELDAMRRVLMNLLINAAEASSPDGTIEVITQCHGDEVLIRVCDRGCGIPDEVLDRLFDPFFTTKSDGTGLGLSIAHRLVEAFSGKLTAMNREDGGAEFRVTLPRTDRVLAAAAAGSGGEIE